MDTLNLTEHGPKKIKSNECLLVEINNFRKNGSGVPSKNKTSETLTDSLEVITTFSTRKPILIRTDVGKEITSKILKVYSELRKNKTCRRYTSEHTKIADFLNKLNKNLPKKPVSEEPNANWKAEKNSVT